MRTSGGRVACGGSKWFKRFLEVGKSLFVALALAGDVEF
jgi:hypothetical protein